MADRGETHPAAQKLPGLREVLGCRDHPRRCRLLLSGAPNQGMEDAPQRAVAFSSRHGVTAYCDANPCPLAVSELADEEVGGGVGGGAALLGSHGLAEGEHRSVLAVEPGAGPPKLRCGHPWSGVEQSGRQPAERGMHGDAGQLDQPRGGGRVLDEQGEDGVLTRGAAVERAVSGVSGPQARMRWKFVQLSDFGGDDSKKATGVVQRSACGADDVAGVVEELS